MDRELQKSLKRIERLEAIEKQTRQKRQRAQERAENLPKVAKISVPPAPTYCPTEEEFADPLGYIESIELEASRYGMCKIVPPPSWKPEFQPRFTAVPDDPTLFYTKRQVVTKKFLVPLEEDYGLAFRFEVQDGYRFFNLAEFEKHATIAELKRSGDATDESSREQQFWEKIAETDRFSVQYGSDMAGSASTEAFGKWELTALANASMLEAIRGGGLPDICGVNLPMMYIGQLFSMFAWHYEDNALQAINYHHKGSCKTWYAVPGSAAADLEELIMGAFPNDDRAAHTINKVTMISPSVVRARGLPVFALRQRPGDIVVTFPLAHHCGFSHGFSVGEAVNFAMPSWIPYGFASLQRYQRLGRDSVLDMEHAILFQLERRCALAQPLPVALAQCGLLLLRWLLAVTAAAAAQNVGVVYLTRKVRAAAEQSEREDLRVMCSHPGCKHILHLAFLVAKHHPRRRCCPEHAAALGVTRLEEVKLMLRYPRELLLTLLAACRQALRHLHPDSPLLADCSAQEDWPPPEPLPLHADLACSLCNLPGHNRRRCPLRRPDPGLAADKSEGDGGCAGGAEDSQAPSAPSPAPPSVPGQHLHQAAAARAAPADAAAPAAPGAGSAVEPACTPPAPHSLPPQHAPASSSDRAPSAQASLHTRETAPAPDAARAASAEERSGAVREQGCRVEQQGLEEAEAREERAGRGGGAADPASAALQHAPCESEEGAAPSVAPRAEDARGQGHAGVEGEEEQGGGTVQREAREAREGEGGGAGAEHPPAHARAAPPPSGSADRDAEASGAGVGGVGGEGAGGSHARGEGQHGASSDGTGRAAHAPPRPAHARPHRAQAAQGARGGKEGGKKAGGEAGEEVGRIVALGGEVLMDLSRWDPAAHAPPPPPPPKPPPPALAPDTAADPSLSQSHAQPQSQSQSRDRRAPPPNPAPEDAEEQAGSTRLPSKRRRHGGGQEVNAGEALRFPRSPFFAVPVGRGPALGSSANLKLKSER